MYKILTLAISFVTFQSISAQISTVRCIGPYCPDFSFPDRVEKSDLPCKNDTKEEFMKSREDCHSYYLCSGNTENATKLICPTGYGYQGEWHMCVPEDQVKSCAAVYCPEYMYDGVIPDPKDCTRYYRCLYGFPHHAKCPRISTFDPESGLCKSYKKGKKPTCLNSKPDHQMTTTYPTTTEVIITNTQPSAEHSTVPIPIS